MRDRAWVLPLYLSHLTAMDLPEDWEVDYFFLSNNCADCSVDILQQFAKRASRVTIENWLSHAPADVARTTENRDRLYGYLGELRDRILDVAIEDRYDYLFSVDTDILVEKDTLTRLADHHKDVVAACICNDPAEDLPDRFRSKNWGGFEGNGLTHGRETPQSLFQVGWTGACYLLSRLAFASGARYGQSPLGEDVPFCKGLAERGIPMWVDGSLRLTHAMTRDTLFLTQEQRSAIRCTIDIEKQENSDQIVGEIRASYKAVLLAMAKQIVREIRELNPWMPEKVFNFEIDPTTGSFYVRLLKLKEPTQPPKANSLVVPQPHLSRSQRRALARQH